VYIKGCNGEDIKNKPLKIEFSRNWLVESSSNKKVSIEVTTQGKAIHLGKLKGVDSITLYLDGEKSASWNLTNSKRRFHV
jgi:hypothetical protein